MRRRRLIVSLVVAAAIGVVAWRAGIDGPAPPPSVPPDPGLTSAQAPAPTGTPVAADADGRWDLIVRVAWDDKPVADATVRVEREGSTEAVPREATTDRAGLATFRDLEKGTVRIEARAKHRARGVLSEVTGSRSLPTRVTMHLPRRIAVDGRVVTAKDGKPVAGARVVVHHGARDSYPSPTDDDGRFQIVNVADDMDTTVTVTATGYRETLAGFVVTDALVRPDPFVVHLDLVPRITGVVLGSDGEPVDGAFVTLKPHVEHGLDPTDAPARYWVDRWEQHVAGSKGEATEITARFGRFEIHDARLGERYDVVAFAAGQAGSETVTVDLSSDMPQRSVALRLRRPARLVVRVVDASGADVAGAIEVVAFQGRAVHPTSVRGADGRFSIDELAPGEATVLVRSRRHIPATFALAVTEAGSYERNVVVEQEVRIEGRVVDERGRPVARAHVVAFPPESQGSSTSISSATAGVDGRFGLGGLSPGRYSLVVMGVPGRDADPMDVTAPASDVAIVLEPRGASVRVRLFEPGRVPFEGHAQAEIGGDRGATQTEEIVDGRLELVGLGTGEATVDVSVLGYAPIVLRFLPKTVRGWTDLPDVVLQTSRELVGRVLDRDGRAIEQAYVNLSAEPRASRLPSRAIPQGRFVTAPATVVVAAEGFLPEIATFDPLQPVRDVRLSRPAAVRARVRRAGGDALEYGSLHFRPVDGTPSEASTRDGRWSGARGMSDERGVVSLELPPGKASLVWHDDADRDVVLGTWTFAEGETRDLEVTIPAK